MLTDLKIRNFIMIRELDLTFEKGMSVLTGETGAGKSILLDAISFALGDRADTSLIRQGENRSEISVCFDITNNERVKAWLSEHGLNQDEDCLIRRILTQDGRSRCYINDQMVSLTRVKELAGYLLVIHGQHHNQLLFDHDYQRQQLDDLECLSVVKQHYRQWQDLLQKEKTLQQKLTEAQNQIDFLNYQLTELTALQLKEGELEKLESQQKQLAKKEQLLRDGNTALQKISESEGEVFKIQGLLKDILTFSKSLESISTLLETAYISLQEAHRDLEDYLEALDTSSDSLQVIEQRLSDIYILARKYRVPPEELLLLQAKLTQELAELTTLDVQKMQLAAEIQGVYASYQHHALLLSEHRREIAEKMTHQVQNYLPELGMADAIFQIKLLSIEPSALGLEQVEFWISTNLGQPLQPLEKIVSGGELSRLNLAIQAVFANEKQTPVFIFDEIDTGMGGATAEQIGRLMRLLAEKTQVISITHLPQVAINAHHHYVVRKEIEEGSTQTRLEKLSEEERTLEIARMLSGVKITDRTLAYAKELLES